jgi:D-glycero-alpha-D-manno-heptose-7-phosphate kinase
VIISRTPLRMSFVGGGSDLPSFYREHGGAVLSTAIDKFVYVSINQRFDDGLRVVYSKTEDVADVEQIEHQLFKSTFKLMDVKGGVEVTTIADIPSKGTGLGSSSSFTVGLINAVAAYQGRYVSAEEMGRDSCRIEIDICGAPIGKQDQYAAAYGGLNLIEFKPDDRVAVSPVIVPRSELERLQRRIIVFYTGITRSASAILSQQDAAVTSNASKQEVLRRMVGLAYEMRDELQRGNLDNFGAILHENWQLKRSLTTGISTAEIDTWYDLAIQEGALGGKILGAGGGGFLMFYANEEHHPKISKALDVLRPVNFGFEPEGSKIIFYNPSNH